MSSSLARVISVHTPRRRCCRWYRFYTRVCARAVRKDYVAFLNNGMHVVYDDLFEADRIRVPASWQSALKGGRSLHALSTHKCIEMIAEIYRLKITQNHTHDEHGKERMELGDFVLVYLRRTHSSAKSLSKILKAFVTGILDAINHRSALVGSGGVHAWFVLFAQVLYYSSHKPSCAKRWPPERVSLSSELAPDPVVDFTSSGA